MAKPSLKEKIAYKSKEVALLKSVLTLVRGIIEKKESGRSEKILSELK